MFINNQCLLPNQRLLQLPVRTRRHAHLAVLWQVLELVQARSLKGGGSACNVEDARFLDVHVSRSIEASWHFTQLSSYPMRPPSSNPEMESW